MTSERYANDEEYRKEIQRKARERYYARKQKLLENPELLEKQKQREAERRTTEKYKEYQTKYQREYQRLYQREYQKKQKEIVNQKLALLEVLLKEKEGKQNE